MAQRSLRGFGPATNPHFSPAFGRPALNALYLLANEWPLEAPSRSPKLFSVPRTELINFVRTSINASRDFNTARSACVSSEAGWTAFNISGMRSPSSASSLFSPRGETKCVRGPSVQGARRSAALGDGGARQEDAVLAVMGDRRETEQPVDRHGDQAAAARSRQAGGFLLGQRAGFRVQMAERRDGLAGDQGDALDREAGAVEDHRAEFHKAGELRAADAMADGSQNGGAAGAPGDPKKAARAVAPRREGRRASIPDDG